jgi:hypothetical protein
MKKTLILITLCLIIQSCQREFSFQDEDDNLIAKAYNWYSLYSQKAGNTHINNTIYYWEKASTFTFNNGYKVITVPILEKNQNTMYQGRRILYLYPWKNAKGFYPVIFELIPTQHHLNKNNGKIDLKSYSGFISSWDPIKGFMRGVQFDNGIPESNFSIQSTSYPQNNKNKSNRINSTGNTPVPTLPEVLVTNKIPGPTSGSYYIILTNGNGYSTSQLWDGGGGNPCEYSGCGYSENPNDYFDSQTLNQISQELLDQQWLEENVIDSTSNPCATGVINSLSSLDSKLPGLIRNFFNSDPNFTMIVKMENNSTWGNGGNAPEAGHTVINTATNQFQVYLNNYYGNSTDLGTAATLIHEAFHCQLMNWFREAVVENDYAKQVELTTKYGYLFPPDFSADSSLHAIVNGGNATQHQDMINRYLDDIGNALYQFAISKNINVDLNYCKDLAWTGTFDSKAFSNLPYNRQESIREKVLAEKDPHSSLTDPSGTFTVNQNNVSPKGTPCN